MPAILEHSSPPPAKPRPGRRRLTLEELLRQAAASVERGPAKLIVGRFRPVNRGRPLTRAEKGLMLLMAGGLALAIWLHAQPEPVSAHTTYYQSLAATTRLEAGAPRTFAESALRELGADWRAATFFACADPAFWRTGPVVHPNVRSARLEQGLARLAGHGPVVSLMSFPSATAVATETINGAEVLSSQVAGQLELADGAVVRFDAHLVQDSASKRWGFLQLSIPGFLP